MALYTGACEDAMVKRPVSKALPAKKAALRLNLWLSGRARSITALSTLHINRGRWSTSAGTKNSRCSPLSSPSMVIADAKHAESLICVSPVNPLSGSTKIARQSAKGSLESARMLQMWPTWCFSRKFLGLNGNEALRRCSRSCSSNSDKMVTTLPGAMKSSIVWRSASMSAGHPTMITVRQDVGPVKLKAGQLPQLAAES
mmetsp:Transcript_88470/g.270812  ORF Transcript_88470/g.270812 Transcript_88470/m.270812 type:complete len:200 (-) Transcript_88470:1370-1969(-)